MALGRAELAVVGVDAGRAAPRRRARGPGAGRTGCRPRCRRPVEPRPAGGRAARSASPRPPQPRADVVAVHRAGQDAVGRRVEPLDELAALVVEVADDRRTCRRPRRRARSARRSRPRCGRWSSPAGGRGPGPRRPSRSMSCDLDVVPGDGHRARSRPAPRSAAPCATRVGPRERDLQRDHAAERAADDEVEPLDARARRAAATARAPGRGSRPPGSAAPYGRPVARVDARSGPVVP